MGIEPLMTLNIYTWHDFLKLKKKPKNQARIFSNADSGPDFLDIRCGSAKIGMLYKGKQQEKNDRYIFNHYIHLKYM